VKTRIIIAASMMVCGATLAQAAPQDNIPGNQLISYQPQADRLALRLAAVIQGAENSASRMSSAAREAAIQSALQDAVMASGDYPRVVLSALQAFSLCPTTAGRFATTPVPVSCENLRQPLSAEAREALASLEKVVLALVDQNDSPAALGISGSPPFQDNDGGSGHRGSGRIIGQGGDHDGSNGGGGSSSDNSPGPTTISSIVTDTGPGGGGSSGYNTN
jgi:uncharacterized membrane protein YgcG